MAKHVSTISPGSTASAKSTLPKPRATGTRAAKSQPLAALHTTLQASLALLDNTKATTHQRFSVRWGFENGHSVIAKETPYSLELQAVRWQYVVDTVVALGEAASAVHDWRDTHTLTHGSVGLAVIADRLAALVPTLREHVETMADMSPTLRASLRRLEARQAKTGGAA
jgi:hypothetical protein